MSAVGEQVLEHALHRHFGATPGDDLSYRVLLRWKAGKAGDPMPRPQGQGMRRWIAAAAVVVAAGLTLWLANRPPAPVLVDLAEPVQVLRGSAWSPTASWQIRAGDTVVLGERSLELDIDGTGLVLQPRTMATFDESGFRIRLGAMQLVHAGPAPFEINTSVLKVRVDGPARLILQINPRERGATMTFPAFARQIYLHTAPTVLVLSLTLVQGRAQAESEGVSYNLPVGELVEQAWIEEQGTEGTKVTPVPVNDPTEDSPALAALMKEVGTWDVETITYDPATGDEMKIKAVEVSKAGPGGAWLISDVTISVPSWENSIHWVVGVDPEDSTKYIGTSVASSGGIMMLEGTLEDGKRIMYARMPVEPGIPEELRMVYSWVSDDERLVAAQGKEGDKWVTGYEMRYRRRK